jgi:hypothetical protein
VTTTEGYLRGREIKISALGLKLPATSNSDALKSADTPDKPATKQREPLERGTGIAK